MISKTRPEIDYSVRRVLTRFLRKIQSLGVDQELTRAIVDTPTLNLRNLQGEVHFSKALKEKDYLVLAILSWYLPEEIGYLLNQSLFDKWKAQNYSAEKEILLSSKDLALSYLQIQDKFNDNDFFGNYLSVKNLERIFRQLRLPKKESRPVKKPVFRRGYNDKGSRRPDHEPEPKFPKEKLAKLLTYREDRNRRMLFLIQKLRIRQQVLLNLRESS